MLEQLGVPDAAHLAEAYAARKQARIVTLIEAGQFAVFPDALRFLQAVRARGIRTAAVSRDIPCITTVQGAAAAVQGIEAGIRGNIGVRALQALQAALRQGGEAP